MDVTQKQVEDLAELAARHGESRAQVIRQAIDSYIAVSRRPISDYFGLWACNVETQDVQGYLDTLRDEWKK